MRLVTSLRGQLLVASPALVDPNFRRAVVLVAEHGEDGAMGVVLNRPSEIRVSDALPGLLTVIADDEPVFRGGPVGPEGVVVLARFSEPGRAVAPIAPDVGFVGAHEEVDDLAGVVRRARAFAGHAGWGPGQLDAELRDDGWILAEAEPDDLFTEDPEALWRRVLERKGGRYALVAQMPLDPSLN